VLDTGNWSALELGRVLQEAVDEATAEDTPAPRASNRKR